MGAKTSLLAFTTADLSSALRASAGITTSRDDAETVVRQLFPDHDVSPLGTTGTLWDDVFPPDDVCYAAVLPGATVVCDVRFAVDRPSQLPARLLDVAGGRRVVLHAMHSVVDWLCFGVWEDGALQRGLSVSPDDGVVEDVGEPLAFELPFRAGAHPVEPWDDDDPAYPLPYHPLELGEEALRNLFGFILEGRPRPDDVDAESVVLHAFSVVDATGGAPARSQDAGRRRSLPGRLLAAFSRAARRPG